MNFKLKSNFKPNGDQPQAIENIVNKLNKNEKNIVLLGATGTGKTFTLANVINNTNRPAIVLSHNKTLAAQLYSEFKKLFPQNRVEYFISNFDYYRPEAYMPTSDTFIDKSSKSNWNIEAMRMSTQNALSTRRDTIVVASVAAIYGQLAPEKYEATFIPIEVGMEIDRNELIHKLVDVKYSRNQIDLPPGAFRVRGDVIEISPGWTHDFFIRIDMFGDEIEGIMEVDTITGEIIKKMKSMTIFPADSYTTKKDVIDRAVIGIEKELKIRIDYFKKEGKLLEAQRIEERVNSDIEQLKEFGVCPGVENYSRYFDEREEGQRPYTILDYFPKDALIIIDESHMMIPQLNAMYNGDRSRKENLVDYGFRLPSALDNRPLKFKEFESNFTNQTIYVSATPSEFEVDKTHGEIVSQVVRPTGLLDPVIDVVPTEGQVEHIYDTLISKRKVDERTFIMTTTKRMAEELAKYLQGKDIKVAYLHSEHKTLEREEILRKLRVGVFEAVIGINLLREGIDIPEVSTVLVLDADKESFFRSYTSLIQMIGRAARNKNGKAIFYADKITKSMRATIDETNNRRAKQIKYNEMHGIVPETIVKPIPPSLAAGSINGAIDEFMHKGKTNKENKKKMIADLRKQMNRASKELDFERAATLRDVIIELETSS